MTRCDQRKLGDSLLSPCRLHSCVHHRTRNGREAVAWMGQAGHQSLWTFMWRRGEPQRMDQWYQQIPGSWSNVPYNRWPYARHLQALLNVGPRCWAIRITSPCQSGFHHRAGRQAQSSNFISCNFGEKLQRNSEDHWFVVADSKLQSGNSCGLE